MRKVVPLVLVVQLALVIALFVALGRGNLPLGVRGEWEWPRLPKEVAATGVDWAVGLAAVTGYAVVAGLGLRFLGDQPPRRREVIAVAGLVVASVTMQVLVHLAAPEGYGLTKWTVALHSSGSSGYYTVAKSQIRDPWRFLRDYPDWIARQDALHIGTHPPGLFIVASGLLRFMESHPATARFVVEHLPSSVDVGFRLIAQHDPLPRADRASLAITGALTLLACASTVLPLYLLARAGSSARAAWSAAALWPLVPAAILFQPAADTAFPLLSVTALVLAAQGARRPSRGGLAAALATGAVLALGMAFTLAFLAVGLIVAIVIASSTGLTVPQRTVRIAATGAGFLSVVAMGWEVTGANPFVVWWWNQRNHARFYVQFPRSYLAWVLVNPLELAIALGLPASVWMVVGLGRPRQAPAVAWSTLAVLAVLTITGRSLSEVARLWLPMMPALLVASGHGIDRVGAGARTFGATVFLTGVQTLSLQATIQVVYPV